MDFVWSLLPRQGWGPGAAQTITVPMAAARTKLGSPFLDGNTEHRGSMGSGPGVRLSHPLPLTDRAQSAAEPDSHGPVQVASLPWLQQ